MHKPIYEDRFEYDKRGNLILITNARGRGYDTNRKLTLECQFDCLKTYENGDQFCRNLYFNYLSGYYVEFPQEYYSYFNYSAQKKPRGYERYAKALQNIKLDSFGFNDHDAEIIYRKYPNFKYVVNKWKGLHSKREMLDILRVWKEHPEIELPLSLGYVKVCFTKSFFKLDKNKLKTLYKFMFNNQGKDYGITDLNYILKHGLETFENVKRISRIMGHKVSAEMADWADGILAGGYEQYHFGSDYHDYLEKAEYIGKDIKDPYWKYPKDFAKRAEMVKEQYANKKRMEDEERAEKSISEYNNRIGKLGGLSKTCEEYTMFIPTTVKQWTTQAEKLHQCIIRMDYPKKCNDNYILIFVYKGGIPYATCEVTDLREEKTQQFYCDEWDKANMYPNDKCKSLVYNWLKELKCA